MRKDRKAVVVGIRDENPGAVVWVWVEGQDMPQLKASGNNQELEEAVIEEANKIAYLEQEVFVEPVGRTTQTITAGLRLEHFPTAVAATLLNTRPGRTEILDIVPATAREDFPEIFSNEGYLEGEEDYLWEEDEEPETNTEQ